MTTTYTYTQGLLTLTNYSDATPDVAITYEPLGRQSTVTTVVAKSEFTYDPATLAVDTEVISYNLDATAGYEFFRVLDRSRDALGRDTGFQLKTASTIVEAQAAYAYSPTDGRIAQISNPQISNQTFSYAYSPNSSLLATVTGPIHTVINQWEPTRDVLDTKTNKLAITVISKYDYTVNAIGQRTGVATSGTAYPAVPSWLWSYDALGQVTAADSSVATSDRTYQYDAIGNRQKSSNSLTLPVANNYTANTLNQYTTIQQGGTGVSPVYDFDGNATAYPLPVSPTTNSTLIWDGENRLTEVKNSTGTIIEKNVFDSGSRKIATTANGITTLYLYDGWNCIAEYTRSVGVSPTLQKTRLWGTDLSGSMQGAGGVGGMLSESSPITSNPITFNSSYPTYDGNGNVSEYLSANGTIAAHFEYDPFGNTVVNTDTGNLFAYRFSTKPRDTETGLYYYGYRYYDPLTGRWPSRDPIEEEGGVNLYGFVGNDVVNRWDLFGLAGWEDYKIVAKSYIDGVGTVGNIRSNAAWLPSELIAANIRLRAFAALAGILPAFNQFPADDSKDGEYRLFGEIKTKFCCDGDKIMNKDWSTDKEGGVEEEHIGISGTVDFSPTINAVGDKFEIEWFLYGRPHRAAELGMQAVQIRTSTQIWQKGKVTFSCKGGEIQKTEDFFKGSRYPTRQYWINDASGNRKDKGPLSSLWSESPSMPGFVAE